MFTVDVKQQYNTIPRLTVGRSWKKGVEGKGVGGGAGQRANQVISMYLPHHHSAVLCEIGTSREDAGQPARAIDKRG